MSTSSCRLHTKAGLTSWTMLSILKKYVSKPSFAKWPIMSACVGRCIFISLYWHINNNNWAGARQNKQKWSVRPAKTQIHQVWSESSLSGWICIAKTLIRLGGRTDWSESSLGAQSFCWFWRASAQFIIDVWHCDKCWVPWGSNYVSNNENMIMNHVSFTVNEKLWETVINVSKKATAMQTTDPMALKYWCSSNKLKNTKASVKPAIVFTDDLSDAAALKTPVATFLVNAWFLYRYCEGSCPKSQ